MRKTPFHGGGIPEPSAPVDLHVCGHCGRPFVVPEALLSILPDYRYLMRLRCNECEGLRIGVFDEDAMAALDVELARDEMQMQRDADVIARALFEEDITRFAEALRLGRILPEDF